jgi:hypothetical protein
MPLEIALLNKYVSDVFVETGTYQGEAVGFAQPTMFKEIHSIELNSDMARAASIKFKNDTRVHIYAGSSDVMLNRILPTITGPVTFWLDAHPIVNPLTLAMTPVAGELEAIRKQLPRLQVHAVLIDDMRVFPANDVLWMENRLKEIFPTYEIYREPSRHSGTDILVACAKRPA